MMAQHPLPALEANLIGTDTMTGDEPSIQTRAVLHRLNTALSSNNVVALKSCFYASQAYWKDQLALTYHLRTFHSPGVIAAALLETAGLRGLGELSVDGAAVFIHATPTLQFIDCGISFRTTSPAATGKGKVVLLPVQTEEKTIEWKIWVLSTMLESLDLQPENQELLQGSGKEYPDPETFETDVFIIGGGNAAAALAARLKTLGVESVMAERNPRVGDNWARRYDCMRFHIPTSFCNMPFMPYGPELQSPHLLTRDDLAEQVRRYVATFQLNIITSAQIHSTRYNQKIQQWQIRIQTPTGQRTAIAKHLVLATGIASQQPYVPSIPEKDSYQGINIHSAQYQNARELVDKGAKSVLVIGSANTAFDVLEDCHAAGLQATMVVRSPTYTVPIEYLLDKRSLGAYDLGVEAGDRLFLSLPSVTNSQLGDGLMKLLSSQEPNRYDALAATGFPVRDSSHPESVLMHNLLERAGGHYVDVGGTKLLVEGKAGVKANVEPTAYTATGLRFSDGSSLDADAVVWCTGFADRDVRDTTATLLGASGIEAADAKADESILGPREIAARVDATWGVDAEGETRGMWKRHRQLDNFWVMGGFTQQHRWHSRTLALQIKAALEGVLPPAYRDTPRF
ncbi:FAD/NAD(P)-binding domain-containing protein [Aspergillus homomorphus CBS 101889]|uniref:FAD/NAD(P)-binding domain-containing protein n=1 Tax=Aspergillus homomorphus (strain CBS 101889) TaxID=1450537 RepID=A0A395I9D9_ASPHC|nr:FAD/NAD(P)-binding domain-containing protein [Aspergillus homomorphus CBS 101889]RAL16575.1 FAD/NAD(P)-binding domain-containing protein [Aspergillus homomorphus CBS 101889]